MVETSVHGFLLDTLVGWNLIQFEHMTFSHDSLGYVDISTVLNKIRCQSLPCEIHLAPQPYAI